MLETIEAVLIANFISLVVFAIIVALCARKLGAMLKKRDEVEDEEMDAQMERMEQLLKRK